jgi:hypothetical protein
VQQKNQYTALSISDVDNSESDSNNVSDNRSDDITTTQVPKQDQRHERNRHSKYTANIPKNTKHNRPTVAILGDSMLKHLNPRKIQHGLEHKVTIKTFPGAGVDEMIHYVRPTQKKTNHVVLHVGTNDLQTKSPDTIITAISRL